MEINILHNYSSVVQLKVLNYEKEVTFLALGVITGLFNVLNAQVQYTGTTLEGSYPSALGYYTKATGNYTFATGFRTTASNTYASAFGYYGTASGIGSAAFGYYGTASGSYALAAGYYSTASGNNSFAAGRYTTAYGLNSFSAGEYTQANAANTFVFGSGTSTTAKLTNSTANSFLIGFSGRPVFFAHCPAPGSSGREPRIGIGTAEPRATLDVNGKIKTVSLEIENDLKIDNNIEFSNPVLSFVYETESGIIVDPGISDTLVFKETLFSTSSPPAEEEPSYALFSSGSGKRIHYPFTINKDRVGIGVREPRSKLHVDNGNVRVTMGKMRVDGEDIYENTTIRSHFQIGDNWLFHKGSPDYQGGNIHIISSNCFVSDYDLTSISYLNTGYASAMIFDKSGKVYLKTAPSKTADASGSFTDGNTVVFTPGGYFGIGTTNPSYKLHVAGNEYITGNSYLMGNVGIGTAFPSKKLHVNGDSYLTGSVGIGTSAFPGAYKLAVKGKIICEEVVVASYLNWADYVFEDNYNLRSLDEVEAFIKENKHLPDIPSAATVEEDGVSLAAMNALLLMKVEELTLYVIELQKQINELKGE